MLLGGGGGGEIPKGGRAGRARSQGIWPGGRDHGGGGRNLWDTGLVVKCIPMQNSCIRKLFLFHLWIDITKFEKQNMFRVNVFGYEGEVYPLNVE